PGASSTGGSGRAPLGPVPGGVLAVPDAPRGGRLRVRGARARALPVRPRGAALRGLRESAPRGDPERTLRVVSPRAARLRPAVRLRRLSTAVGPARVAAGVQARRPARAGEA